MEEAAGLFQAGHAAFIVAAFSPDKDKLCCILCAATHQQCLIG